MDSVGSKLMLARRAGRLRWAGMDLAAHCINDVLCTGAEPLFLLDYVAANRIDEAQVAELVEGAAEICRSAGCVLIGGETAELPGIYQESELDFAGTCVGLVERSRVIDGSRCEAGDTVIGFASSGLHTNGFSLVRTLVGDGDFDADLLLAPHTLYLDEVRRLQAHADVRALAHVTGGGIMGNLSRVLPDGTRGSDRLGRLGAAARLRLARRARSRGRRAPPCVQPRHRHVRRRPRRARGCDRDRRARMIGVLVSGEGTNLQALIDAGLPIAAVASNRRDAGALARADAAGIPNRVFELDAYSDRAGRDRELADWLQLRGVDFVVLAGYMHLLTPVFLDRFRDRIVNVHPSLLPQFPGGRAIADALDAGVDTTGVTVHYVDEGLDTGTVIRQEPVAVEPRATLVERIHAVEHRILPEVVRELCAH